MLVQYSTSLFLILRAMLMTFYIDACTLFHPRARLAGRCLPATPGTMSWYFSAETNIKDLV